MATTEIIAHSNTHPVEVPLVFNDLSEKLTIEDTLHALTQLQGAFDHTFKRLENRLNDEKARLSYINKRTEVCYGKVNSVRGSIKATTVFSTARFPGPKKCIPIPATFVDTDDLGPPFQEPDDDIHYSLPQPELSIVGNRTQTQEIFDMYQSLNDHGTEMIRAEFIMEDKGLGKLPTTIPSVGSCLLFNSRINPYSDYQTLDNLMSAGKTKVEDETEKDGLQAAPSTLISGDVLPDITALDLTFRPQMGEMASLALPSNLPLDFLADIQYDAAAQQSIAPSAHRQAIDMTLPQITDGTNNRSYAAPPSAKETKPTKNVPPPPPSNDAPPPPPPSGPPPPVENTAPPPPPQETTNTEMPKSSMPPPPVNPMENLKPPDETERPASDTPPARMGLLDAIKGMNVNKLRSKEEAEVKAAKVQVKQEVKKPMSMMDEMRARMQRRNSAISGKQGRRESMRDGELVKAAREATKSSMIDPPKPLSSNAIMFGTVDEDEDDDDASVTSSDASVSSGSSFGGSAKAIVPFSNPPPKPKPKAEVKTAPVVQPPVEQKRGSLLDSENATNLLITAKIREEEVSASGSEEDDDWD